MSDKERDLTDVVHLKLRFREDLRRQLEQSARRSGRSLNGEMIRILEDAMRSDAQATDLRAIVREEVQAAMKAAV